MIRNVPCSDAAQWAQKVKRLQDFTPYVSCTFDVRLQKRSNAQNEDRGKGTPKYSKEQLKSDAVPNVFKAFLCTQTTRNVRRDRLQHSVWSQDADRVFFNSEYNRSTILNQLHTSLSAKISVSHFDLCIGHH